ncbi:unnamed protein product [Diplocarpon coronariae]
MPPTAETAIKRWACDECRTWKLPYANFGPPVANQKPELSRTMLENGRAVWHFENAGIGGNKSTCDQFWRQAS